MKAASAVKFGVVLALGVLLGVLAPFFVWDVWAEEPDKDVRSQPISYSRNATPEKFGVSTDRPFPSFCIEEVVVRITAAADDLIAKGLVKSSPQLKKDIDRTSVRLTLPKPSPKEISLVDHYRRACESVFLVVGLTRPTAEDKDWKTSFSTAFVIHESGVLATSAHVFDHNDKDDAVVAMDFHGNVYPVLEILAANRHADTLLFRIESRGLKPLSLGNDAPPGSTVRIMGHPGDSFYFFSVGHIANYERDDDNNSWLNVTADFGQGASGGPAMDEAGNVIGQVSRTYTLYATGPASNRAGRRSWKKLSRAETKEEAKPSTESDDADDSKKNDPQMVFKACTPVSAIQAMIK